MRPGDLYFASLDPALGHEQQGHRPVLIVSQERFNRAAGVAVVVPITSGGAFSRNRGFAVQLENTPGITGFVLCNQLRTLDIAARRGRFVETVSAAVLDQVMVRVRAILV